MLSPTLQDIAAVKAWPNAKAPLAALEEYSTAKSLLRWLKLRHLLLYATQWTRRAQMARDAKDLQNYYRTAIITHEPLRWEYLKRRKAWYIAPWGWERFAAPGCSRILDAGCGDADVTSRVADFVEECWEHSGAGHSLEITGLDLNRSRMESAARFCGSSRPEISFSFAAADCVTHIPFPDGHFDYALVTGVLETLDDTSASSMAAELCRTTRKGVYIEDLADKFPGGYPHRSLDGLFAPHGMRVTGERKVFTEPFSMWNMPDPCWRDFGLPLLTVRLAWVERIG